MIYDFRLLSDAQPSCVARSNHASHGPLIRLRRCTRARIALQRKVKRAALQFFPRARNEVRSSDLLTSLIKIYDYSHHFVTLNTPTQCSWSFLCIYFHTSYGSLHGARGLDHSIKPQWSICSYSWVKFSLQKTQHYQCTESYRARQSVMD